MGSFLTLVGIGASALISIWGMKKSEKQQAGAIELHEREFGTQLRFKEEELAMAKRKEAAERKQTKKEWEWMEEGRNYDRAKDTVGRFIGLLDRGPAFTNNLVNLWPKHSMRRAA